MRHFMRSLPTLRRYRRQSGETGSGGKTIPAGRDTELGAETAHEVGQVLNPTSSAMSVMRSWLVANRCAASRNRARSSHWCGVTPVTCLKVRRK